MVMLIRAIQRPGYGLSGSDVVTGEVHRHDYVGDAVNKRLQRGEGRHRAGGRSAVEVPGIAVMYYIHAGFQAVLSRDPVDALLQLVHGGPPAIQFPSGWKGGILARDPNWLKGVASSRGAELRHAPEGRSRFGDHPRRPDPGQRQARVLVQELSGLVEFAGVR